MLALWPVLFDALLEGFMRFQPGWTGVADNGRVLPTYKMRFGKALLQELAEGRYVADRG